METAETVVRDILSEVFVQAAEQGIEAVDFNTAVRYMNRYMQQLAVTVPLGYTKVTYPTDLITIPDGAINGLIFNVAMKIASQYDVDISLGLSEGAKDGLMAMRKIARSPVRSTHPSTLPIGSGNHNCNGRQKFYVGNESAIATEQNGTIILEDTTNE